MNKNNRNSDKIVKLTVIFLFNIMLIINVVNTVAKEENGKLRGILQNDVH